MNRLKGHGAKCDSLVENTLGVRIELPYGLGLSEDGVKLLIDGWIVPELIRVFIRETCPPKSVQSETFETTGFRLADEVVEKQG